jgi:hypothetical protein
VAEGLQFVSSLSFFLQQNFLFKVSFSPFFLSLYKKRLTQLNLGCISQKWSEKELMTVIGALPVSLEQLNISGFRYVLKDARKFPSYKI